MAWRRRDDSARTRRKILISTQVDPATAAAARLSPRYGHAGHASDGLPAAAGLAAVWKSTSELGCLITSIAWGARNLISTQVLADHLPRAATALLQGGAPEAEALLRCLIEVMWVPSQDEALVEELRRVAPATTLGGVAAQLLAGR